MVVAIIAGFGAIGTTGLDDDTICVDDFTLKTPELPESSFRIVLGATGIAEKQINYLQLILKLNKTERTCTT